MKSAAKRDNYCELQDILSSNNLNANSGFGYSWSHVRLRVDNYKTTNMHRFNACCQLGVGIVRLSNAALRKLLCLTSANLLTVNVG